MSSKTQQDKNLTHDRHKKIWIQFKVFFLQKDVYKENVVTKGHSNDVLWKEIDLEVSWSLFEHLQKVKQNYFKVVFFPFRYSFFLTIWKQLLESLSIFCLYIKPRIYKVQLDLPYQSTLNVNQRISLMQRNKLIVDGRNGDDWLLWKRKQRCIFNHPTVLSKNNKKENVWQAWAVND